MSARDRDAVDRIIDEWGDVREDLDVSPMAVIGRISRLSRLIDRRLAENFADHGIESWMYDVLATLRRSGEPFELSPGDLVAQSMVTTGAITNRLDRLEERGLVRRLHSTEDRRKVIVRLTDAGRTLVDDVAPRHYELERTILLPLDGARREELTDMLRTLLVSLGDTGES